MKKYVYLMLFLTFTGCITNKTLNTDRTPQQVGDYGSNKTDVNPAEDLTPEDDETKKYPTCFIDETTEKVFLSSNKSGTRERVVFKQYLSLHGSNKHLSLFVNEVINIGKDDLANIKIDPIIKYNFYNFKRISAPDEDRLKLHYPTYVKKLNKAISKLKKLAADECNELKFLRYSIVVPPADGISD